MPIHKQSKNPTIATTIFPVYDITQNVLKGTNLNIKLIVPPGTEIHDYDPTPQDISSLQNAKIIIYNGGESEAWIDKILANINSDTTVVRLMDYIDAISHDDDDNEYDEHIWLSPKNNIAIINKLSKIFSTHFQDNSAQIQSNTNSYAQLFQQLDQSFSELASKAQNRPIVIADHFPFAYFVRDYGFLYEAAYSGCSHDSEPSSAKISELIETIKTQNISTIFTTEFSNQNIAKTITNATNANIKILYSAETVSASDLSKVTLLELEQRNYNTLRDYYDTAN